MGLFRRKNSRGMAGQIAAEVESRSAELVRRAMEPMSVVPGMDMGTLVNEVRGMSGDEMARQLAYAERATKLAREGIDGRATVRATRETGSSPMTGAEVEFDLSVTSPNRPPYPATIKQYLPPAAVTGIPVGTEVPVKIDPDDPESVLIWGGLPSAGASPAPGLPVVTAGPSGGSVPPTPTLRDSRQGAMSEQQFELEQLRASDEERLHATPHHGALRRLRVGAAVVLLMACLGVGLAVVLTTVPKLHGSRLAATVTPVPGSRDVPLAVGSYVVYYEADSPGDIGLSPPRVRVRIGSPSGRPLPLKRYGGNFHTGSSYVDARAIFTVEVPTPGTYRISATGELSQPGFSDPRIVLGMPFGSKVLKIVGGGLLALFAFIGLTFFLQRVLEGVRSR